MSVPIFELVASQGKASSSCRLTRLPVWFLRRVERILRPLNVEHRSLVWGLEVRSSWKPWRNILAMSKHLEWEPEFPYHYLTTTCDDPS